jgi:ABC-type nitrate/sulfonate/bicarbonate transport system ATPase subunit
VSVSYRDQRGVLRPAVRGVSFDVDAGEFVALIGPSGCGKSTLLNAAAGLVEPDEGKIALDGDASAARLGRVAYMQQRDLLLPWRTALQNARLGLEFHGVARAEADRLAIAGAQRFGLGDVLGSYPWQLSGGMRQRVALLRSSLPESGLLLLDEPFGALDAITRRDLQQWLAEVLDRSARAVVLVTHDVEEALLLADRVHVMSPGPGTLKETVEVVLPRPRTEETVTSAQFIELKRRLLAALSGAPGVVPR